MTDDPGVPAIKELAKVGNSLINKISKAVGVLYEPTHIKRIAKAKARAAVIEAEGKVQVTELERRTFERWLQEEERNQRNMEAVTQLAIEHLKPDANPEQINDDWLVDLFEKVKKVSDEQMQVLWAKVLAGEANASGSFSKLTLHVLSVMEGWEARGFTRVCTYCVDFGDDGPVPFIFALGLFEITGLSYPLLVHLDRLGVIRLLEGSNFVSDLKDGSQGKYGEKSVRLSRPTRTHLRSGMVTLPRAGVQLYKLCEITLDTSFINNVNRWIKRDDAWLLEASETKKDPR